MFTNKFVLSAVEKIGAALRKCSHYHVVNITSTVMPGSTAGEIRACLERASGRRVGDNLGLTYNPEFIALGSVVRDFLFPDMLLIGQSDERAGDLLQSIYEGTVELNPPVQRMNLINAEITKIAINTYVTTKISYANMLSDLCDHLAGADVNVVTDALGKDSRIGRKYITGALGYGGPCFPRDNVAFSALARSLGAAPDLAEATDAINQRQVRRLADKVRELGGDEHSVSILGMSYKPGTPVVDQSQGVMLARVLAESGCEVAIFDPMSADAAAAVLPKWVRRACSLRGHAKLKSSSLRPLGMNFARCQFRPCADPRARSRSSIVGAYSIVRSTLTRPILHYLGKGPDDTPPQEAAHGVRIAG